MRKKVVVVLAAVLCLAVLAFGIARLISGNSAGQDQGTAPEKTGEAGTDQQKQENEYYDSGKLKTEYVYDDRGQLAKTNTYNEDGTLSSCYTVHAYDENGLPAAYTIYNQNFSAEGIRTSERIAEYGPGNKLTRFETREYDVEGLEEYSAVYEYDSDEKNTRCTVYQPDGSVDFYVLLDYDDQGNNIKQSHYHADGSLYLYDVIEYNPDRSTKRTTFDRNGEMSYEFTYDERGRTIRDYRSAENGGREYRYVNGIQYCRKYKNTDAGTEYGEWEETERSEGQERAGSDQTPV